MKPSSKKKKVYPPHQDGTKLLCSRCFNTLGDIKKYGHDEKGYWFIAPCKNCGANMKWYRRPDGKTETERQQEDETFTLTMINGELTLTLDK